MVKVITVNKHILLSMLLCLCFFFSKDYVIAAEEQGSALENVVDEADIFSDSEETALFEACQALLESQNVNAIILTTNQIDGTRKQYIEDYYDANETALSDAAILLINMQSDDRGVEIQGYGSCEFTISDDRIASILEEILPYLKESSYYDAAASFVQLCDYFVAQGASTNYQHTEADNAAYDAAQIPVSKEEAFVKQTFFNLIIALVIGAVVVFIMAYNSGGRVTTSQSTYLDSGNSRILGRYDRYIRTTTTRIPKPKPADTSSGGGGVSSGGNSHSGGGSSF